MPLYRTQVALQMDSGVPEDRAVNTWWCIADDLTALGLFVTQLGTFYQAIDNYLSSAVNTTGHVIKSYDMADPEPRAPVLVVTGTTLTTGTTAMPAEVATCMSFQAVQQSGQSQARRRGRVYIGPLAQNTLHSSGTPEGAWTSALVAAGQALLDASDAAATWSWAVYSRVDQTAISVSNGWVDNAFDTQRRRGPVASARAIFS